MWSSFLGNFSPGTLFVSWGFKPAQLRSSTAQPAHSSFLGASSLPAPQQHSTAGTLFFSWGFKRCKNLRSGTAGTLFVSWGFKPSIWQLSKVHTLCSGSAWPADSSFLGGSSLPFGRPKRCKNLRSGTAGTLFVSWGFKPAVWQPSRVHKLRSSTAQPANSSFLGGSSLPFGRPKRCKNPRSGTAGTLFVSWGAAAQHGRQTLLFLGVQACRLAGLKGAKTSAAAQPAHSSFLGASSLPFGSLQGCTSSAAAQHSRHTLLFLGI